MMHLPLSLTLHITSQRCRLAAGSMPVVGSSKYMTGGSPMRAIAVLNLRLLPPLEVKEKCTNVWLLINKPVIIGSCLITLTHIN
jgi:hypothetical protein